jgi:hypothetical protein
LTLRVHHRRIPRNADQPNSFLESYDIDGVINLELPDAEVERRVLARGCVRAAAWTTT